MSLEETAMSLEETAMSLEETAMSLEETAMSLVETAMSLVETAMSLEETAMSLEETAMSLVETAMSLVETAMPVQHSSTFVTQFSGPFAAETVITIREMLFLWWRRRCVCNMAGTVDTAIDTQRRISCMYRRLHWSDTVMYEEVCSAVAGKDVVTCITAPNVGILNCAEYLNSDSLCGVNRT